MVYLKFKKNILLIILFLDALNLKKKENRHYHNHTQKETAKAITKHKKKYNMYLLENTKSNKKNFQSKMELTFSVNRKRL